MAGGLEWFYTHGCAVADYDRDGWPDLLVTGYGRLALFHNEPLGGEPMATVKIDLTADAGTPERKPLIASKAESPTAGRPAAS